MKGIRICGDCVNYSHKKHKCLLGCNQESDPRSKFFDDCPLPDVIEIDDVVVEQCSECGNEVRLKWDVDRDGRTVYCPYCGYSMEVEQQDRGMQE